MSGVLVVDKPKGPTSHDVVARLRRILRTREVGHSGTLDPMATGVLVVAVGEGTKLVPWLTADDKAYEARIRLGVGTDTLDAEGRVVEERPPAPEVLSELARLAHGAAPEGLIASAIAAEIARVEQVPPAYSAIKVQGVRAHVLARAGQETVLLPRAVAVRTLRVTGAGVQPEPFLDVTVHVAKGYFVRALARDLAERLGTKGHLTALRRVRSGAFGLDDAVPLDADPDAVRAALIPLAQAASRALPPSTLTATGVVAARHGQRVPATEIAGPAVEAPSAWLDEAGALVAVGTLEADGRGRVLRGFV